MRLSKKGCHCKLQLSEGVAWYRECCCRQWSPGLTPGSQDMLWLEKLHNPKGTWWLSLSQTAFFFFSYLVPVFLILKSLILKLWFKLGWCSWRRMNQSKNVPLRALRLQGAVKQLKQCVRAALKDQEPWACQGNKGTQWGNEGSRDSFMPGCKAALRRLRDTCL